MRHRCNLEGVSENSPADSSATKWAGWVLLLLALYVLSTRPVIACSGKWGIKFLVH